MMKKFITIILIALTTACTAILIVGDNNYTAVDKDVTPSQTIKAFNKVDTLVVDTTQISHS